MNDLPWFKFHIRDYMSGDIQLASLEAQGAFVNLCCAYWKKQGCISNAFALRLLCVRNADAQTLIDELAALGCIKVTGDTIAISFLDEQLAERKAKSEKCQKAANKRWSADDASAMHPHDSCNANGMPRASDSASDSVSSEEGMQGERVPTERLHGAGSDQWRLCAMLAAVLLKHDRQRIMPNSRDWRGYLEVITELTQKYEPSRLAAIFKLMEHRGFPKNGSELDLSSPWWLRKSFKIVEDHAYAMTVEADRKQLAEWSKREFPN